MAQAAEKPGAVRVDQGVRVELPALHRLARAAAMRGGGHVRRARRVRLPPVTCYRFVWLHEGVDRPQQEERHWLRDLAWHLRNASFATSPLHLHYSTAGTLLVSHTHPHPPQPTPVIVRLPCSAHSIHWMHRDGCAPAHLH
jgi:hypothetical protein